MQIGIVGVGVVGGAIKYGFEKLGHNVLCHDVKNDTTIENVLPSELCFICVPTPSGEDGRCDVHAVEQTVASLSELGYEGIVSIKSTVEPGTTERLQGQYPGLRLCFVPEFLRERCAISDFIEKHDVCVIGTRDTEVYEVVKEAHGKYPREFCQLTPSEAEAAKYFNNLYHATLITFANAFYDVCDSLDVDYTLVKNAMIKQEHIVDRYLDCNEKFRAFGGVCLPKDLKAIISLGASEGIDVDFFKSVESQNKKYKVSVFEGMRMVGQGQQQET